MLVLRNIGWNGFSNGSLYTTRAHAQTHEPQQNKRPLTDDEMVVFVDYTILSFINDTNNVCTFMSSSRVLCKQCPLCSLPRPLRPAFVSAYRCDVNRRENIYGTQRQNVFFRSLVLSPFKVSTAKWLLMMMMVHRTMVRYVINDWEQVFSAFLSFAVSVSNSSCRNYSELFNMNFSCRVFFLYNYYFSSR